MCVLRRFEEECFWLCDGNAWYQFGDCPKSCSCIGKPTEDGTEGDLVVGVCECKREPPSPKHKLVNPSSANGNTAAIAISTTLVEKESVCFLVRQTGNSEKADAAEVYTLFRSPSVAIANWDETKIQSELKRIAERMIERFVEREGACASDQMFFRLIGGKS